MPSLIYDSDPDNPDATMLASNPSFPSSLSQAAAASKMPMHLQQHDHDDSPHQLYSSFPGTEPIPLPPRFANLKRNLVAGTEATVTASWHRLLDELRAEIDVIARTGTDIIPEIDFSEIEYSSTVEDFSARLKRRGCAVIRNVVPRERAVEWKRQTQDYLNANPYTKGFPSRNPQLFELYWSPAQVAARADPDVIRAQKFAMRIWNKGSSPDSQVCVEQPLSYADRLRMRMPGDTSLSLRCHMDGGSIERWERDGYGRSGTYKKIWQGEWEDYDPWDASTRLGVTSDLYNGAGSCSVFRMFQGTLAMSHSGPGEGTLLVCPMLRLATAYVLLRPLFAPITPMYMGGSEKWLEKHNWVLAPQRDSVIHGALPGYTQEISTLLHPHLQLDRSLVSVPATEPGDYVVWHPDLVHAVDGVHGGTDDSSVLYVPSCPLTQTNALFLARQRKAFLLGHPGPDFEGGRGERDHVDRPGVQEVSDVGGDEGLRAMGLMPFEGESRLVRMCNAILFPDRFDMV